MWPQSRAACLRPEASPRYVRTSRSADRTRTRSESGRCRSGASAQAGTARHSGWRLPSTSRVSEGRGWPAPCCTGSGANWSELSTVNPPSRWIPKPWLPIMNAGRIGADGHHAAVGGVQRDEALPHRATRASLRADAERISAIEGDVHAPIGRGRRHEPPLAGCVRLDPGRQHSRQAASATRSPAPDRTGSRSGRAAGPVKRSVNGIAGPSGAMSRLAKPPAESVADACTEPVNGRRGRRCREWIVSR